MGSLHSSIEVQRESGELIAQSAVLIPVQC
jgi:hypothetical protein